MVGTAGLPHVIVRFFTVPKVKDARKSAGWALLFIAILYTTAPAIAVFARTNLIETIVNKPYAEKPQWVDNWEKTKLVSWEDKNNDGLVQYYNDKNPAFAAKAAANGWNGSELNVDKDIIVLANPEIAGLPNWVIALVAAGGLAAALSTAAGLLLVISTSISHDLIKKQIAPNIGEKMELVWARVAAGVAVVVAGYFGINPPGFVASVVALAFGLAAASFFPAIIMGIFSKRMNKEGAISGIIVGLVITMFYIAKFKLGWIGNAEDNTEANWWFGISPEGFGTVGMFVNFAVAIIVSRFTPAPPQDVQDLVEDIRIPSGAGQASTH
jgi:cation/acetate symporter